MAQWIRRWSTEPEILGSIPSGVVFLHLPFLFSRFYLVKYTDWALDWLKPKLRVAHQMTDTK